MSKDKPNFSMNKPQQQPQQKQQVRTDKDAERKTPGANQQGQQGWSKPNIGGQNQNQNIGKGQLPGQKK